MIAASQDEHWSPAILNQHIFNVIFDEHSIDKRFLQLSINQKLDELIGKAHGGVGLRHVTKGMFEETKIDLPPLDEQRRIVAKLDSLFTISRNAREELKRIPKLVERYKQAILTNSFDRAIECEPSWQDLGTIATQVRNGISRKPEHDPPGIPILKIFAVRPMMVRMGERRYLQPISGEDITGYELAIGDLLFTRYNGNAELVGNCGMVRNINGPVVYPDKLIRVRINQGIDPAFIELLVAAPQVRRELSPYIKTAAGQHGISGADLKRLRLPIPPLTIQSELIASASAAFAGIEKLTTEAARGNSLLDRVDREILAKAFRGELVPQSMENDTTVQGVAVA